MCSVVWIWSQSRSSSPLQVRTVSAKALGAMVKGMGESCYDDLLPWLMETLASEQSSVDRSGAAQGQFFFTLLLCCWRFVPNII